MTPILDLGMHQVERFWSKVDRTPDGCWEWLGTRHVRGYGSFDAGRGNRYIAHRMAYVLTNGPIPEGLTIDHLCRNKGCVNPDHMEPVTAAVNTIRAHVKDRCVRDHDMALTRRRHPNGKPYCAECQTIRNAKRYARV